MYQKSNVIKAAAAAARTNLTREIRQELKATDPDRSRGTDVESSSIVDGGTSLVLGWQQHGHAQLISISTHEV